MKVEIYENGTQVANLDTELRRGSAVTIGRVNGSADFKVGDERVSRLHAQVVIDDQGRIFFVDLKSTNGSTLNGTKLSANTPVALSSGDKVVLGGGHTQVVVGGLSGANKNSIPKASEGNKLSNLLDQNPVVRIGRNADNDWVLEDPSVSRHHATVKRVPGGGVFLTDNNSTNGTFVNGRKISGTVQISENDDVVIGRSRFSLKNAARNLRSGASVRVNNLTFSFANGKIGLRNVNLELESGKLLAIMGPSGCGKSTLLKCMTGELAAAKGSIYLHENELRSSYDLVKTLIGYVPQDDIVHKELTVDQALYYAAKLRLPNASGETISRKIDEVVQRLRVQEIRKNPIERISGGQRKRVCIAMELLTDPLILFLDEPTSPLDPQTIEEFMKILKDLAAAGTTVVMVTHKPEDLEFMDEVLFLAEGGFPVYLGDARRYKQYFEVGTAVEVYAMLSGGRAERWIQKAKGQANGNGNTNPPLKPGKLQKRTGNLVSQTFWLSARYLNIKLNDRMNALILLGQAPIIACLILMIFGHVSTSVPFLLTLSAVWLGCSNAAREIVGEASIYRRERMFNLAIGPYLISKLMVLATVGLIQAATFALILQIGFGSDDPPIAPFLPVLLWIWFLTCCATVLGLFLSALANSVEKVMTIVPLVLIPQVMLSGVVEPIKKDAVEMISYLTPVRWGNEGLMLIQDSVKVEQFVPNELFGDSQGPSESVEVNRGSADVLQDQFAPLYDKLFGEAARTVALDTSALLVLTTVLLLGLIIAMKRKDVLG